MSREERKDWNLARHHERHEEVLGELAFGGPSWERERDIDFAPRRLREMGGK